AGRNYWSTPLIVPAVVVQPPEFGVTASTGGCRASLGLDDRGRPSPHGRLRFLLAAFFAFFYGRLEILDTFAQALAQSAEFARSEQEQRNGKNQQNLRQSQFSRHKNLQRGCPARAQQQSKGPKLNSRLVQTHRSKRDARHRTV